MMAHVDADIQNDLKLNIKIWLKANRRDYAWLAENCYVSESTVRNWMARKSIPRAKEHIIRQLIAQKPVLMPQQSVDVTSETILKLKLDSDTRRKLEEKAFSQGLTLEELLSRTVLELSKG